MEIHRHLQPAPQRSPGAGHHKQQLIRGRGLGGRQGERRQYTERLTTGISEDIPRSCTMLSPLQGWNAKGILFQGMWGCTETSSQLCREGRVVMNCTKQWVLGSSAGGLSGREADNCPQNYTEAVTPAPMGRTILSSYKHGDLQTLYSNFSCTDAISCQNLCHSHMFVKLCAGKLMTNLMFGVMNYSL